MVSMMRIGLVSDTHCPEFLDTLPRALIERLRGVDAILHCGDVGGPGGSTTLRALERIAPVIAIRGDHDRDLELDLPDRRELMLGGLRIGMAHGHRSHVIEEPVTFLNTISLGRLDVPRPGHQAWLRRQFPRADVIVYGHTHVALVGELDGALLVNPGPVYQVTRTAAMHRLRSEPGWFEWSWLQVIRRRLDEPICSMGILETGGGGRPRVTIHRL
jgi:putative phosphoesterase